MLALQDLVFLCKEEIEKSLRMFRSFNDLCPLYEEDFSFFPNLDENQYQPFYSNPFDKYIKSSKNDFVRSNFFINGCFIEGKRVWDKIFKQDLEHSSDEDLLINSFRDMFESSGVSNMNNYDLLRVLARNMNQNSFTYIPVVLLGKNAFFGFVDRVYSVNYNDNEDTLTVCIGYYNVLSILSDDELEKIYERYFEFFIKAPFSLDCQLTFVLKCKDHENNRKIYYQDIKFEYIIYDNKTSKKVFTSHNIEQYFKKNNYLYIIFSFFLNIIYYIKKLIINIQRPLYSAEDFSRDIEISHPLYRLETNHDDNENLLNNHREGLERDISNCFTEQSISELFNINNSLVKY